MQYITGIHALNLPCSLETCGDWHQSAIQWKNPRFRDTKNSFFGEYGIETGVAIPGHTGTFAAANHIRALLDLLEAGNFSVAQGMNKDYICNDAYNEEVFEKAASMRFLPNWAAIDRFMCLEYYMKWVNYKNGAGL